MPHAEQKENVFVQTPLIERGTMPVVILTLICMICVTLLAQPT